MPRGPGIYRWKYENSFEISVRARDAFERDDGTGKSTWPEATRQREQQKGVTWASGELTAYRNRAERTEKLARGWIGEKARETKTLENERAIRAYALVERFFKGSNIRAAIGFK